MISSWHITLHTQPTVLRTFYSFFLLVTPYPRSKPKPRSGGGSVLRTPGVGVQGGHGNQWGKIEAFSVLENMLPGSSCSPEDKKRVK